MSHSETSSSQNPIRMFIHPRPQRRRGMRPDVGTFLWGASWLAGWLWNTEQACEHTFLSSASGNDERAANVPNERKWFRIFSYLYQRPAMTTATPGLPLFSPLCDCARTLMMVGMFVEIKQIFLCYVLYFFFLFVSLIAMSSIPGGAAGRAKFCTVSST